MDADNAMRAVVIVNRRLLARPPTNHKHFDCFIPANSMTPVITFLESDVGLKLAPRDLDVCEPGVYLFERRRRGLAVQLFNQL